VTTTKGTLVRSGYDFELDGSAFPGITVRRLAIALEAPAVAAPPDTGLGAAFLRSYADRALEWSFDDPAARRSVRSAYTLMFLDPDRFHRFLAHLGPWKWNHTDDDHRETVTISCALGAPIVATTQSQVYYGVPWTVRDDRGTTTTYNPEVGRRLSALLGDRDVNHSRYGDDDVARAYASDVLAEYVRKCGVPDPFDRLPEIEAAPGAAGFTHDHQGLYMRSHGDDYFVQSPEQPGFQLYGVIRGDERSTAADAIIASSHAMFARLRAFPWLRKALSEPAQQGFSTPPESEDFDVDEAIGNLQKAGLTSSAELLAANAYTAISINLHRPLPADLFHDLSEWYLLQDGRLMLLRFSPGSLTALGLPESAFPTPESGNGVGGQVFSPNGTWRMP
jgi:hypothetical protein